MSKSIFLILIVAMISACGGADTNSNANANQANLPPEFQQQPVTPSGNTTPGIPDPAGINMNVNNPKGTPTPGIPDPANLTPKKGATPTPGIPDEKTLREQMKKLYGNANATPASNVKPKTVRKP
jgi:hypothetical protein